MASVRLDWSFSGICDGFHVYRKAGVPAYGAPLAVVPSTVFTYTDVTAALNVTYNYAVAAFNISGDSVLKETTIVLTVPVPQALTMLTATEV